MESETSVPKKVILSVDNNTLNQDVTKRFLASTGYQLIQASSGDEALEVLSQQHVDLVLTAIILPGMSGLGLAQQVRSDFPYLPTVALSSVRLENKEVMASGLSDWLLIPVTKAVLVETIQKFLG